MSEKLSCWICDKKFITGFAVRFTDKNKKKRLGSICKECWSKMKPSKERYTIWIYHTT
jgi:hypothetical protein